MTRSDGTIASIGLAIALTIGSMANVANAESDDCDREMKDAQQAIKLIKGITDRGISRARQADVPCNLISEMQSAGNDMVAALTTMGQTARDVCIEIEKW